MSVVVTIIGGVEEIIVNAGVEGKQGATGPAGPAGGLQSGDNISELVNDAGYIMDGDKVIQVFTKSDLPTPAGGVITLPDTDVRYKLYNNIDLDSDRLLFQGDNVQVYGASPNVGFISTTTGALITTDKTLALLNMNLIGFSASSLVNAVDSSTHGLTMESMGLIGGPTTDLVMIDSYENLIITLVGFYSGRHGLVLGNNITNLSVNLCQFKVNVTGINIDLNGCLSEAISIHNCVSVLSATSTFIAAASDSGNITPTGGGTVSENKIDDSIVGAVISTGLSPLDLRWLAIGNNNINGSDRLNPTGWGFYVDGDTVTQVAPAGEGNAIKFSIDGLGAISDSDYLPRVIRGTSELFDVSTSDITPITIGDAYTLRVSFVMTGKSGNPNLLNLYLDIGPASGITVPIVKTSVPTPNSFPHPVMFTIDIHSKATFLANGGQIMLFTDAGSISIEERGMQITRISSGAS